jgi:23S rRNA pseudouridine2605 synthase
MRLNKYIAQHGIASRRKADQLIQEGKVLVNGKILSELGYDVKEGDRVQIGGILLEGPEERVYYALHKPLGYITAAQDPQGRPVVTDLLTDVTQRVFPVGRLDYDTSGLLIMTNDGQMSFRMSHPKHQVPKTYEAWVTGHPSKERIHKLKSGVDIGGYITKPAQVELLKESEKGTLLQITIHEGKNRQVRKMLKAVGHPVVELKRTSVGEIRLGRLMAGHYRKLNKEEMAYLQSL